MNTLRLEIINQHAPYMVKKNPHAQNSYLFKTDSQTEFIVSLQENCSIVPSGTYEFSINNPKHERSPLDPKLRNTIFAIIEEFFMVNGEEAMLYLAETGDGKQSFRNRLFIRWFNSYEHREEYFIKTAEGMMDGQMNFIAIFSRRHNPRLAEVIEEFNETISFLFDSPEDNLVIDRLFPEA